jgi:PAS domain S-box-containing protein
MASLGVRAEDLMEFSSDAIMALDAGWNYVFINHAGELLLRRKRDTVLGHGHWELYPELLGTPAEASLRKAVRLQCPIKYEQYIPGLYTWFSVLAVPSGNGVTLFCRDISDRVRLLNDQAVREGIRSILEDIPVAITLTRGPQHRIDLQNAFSRRVLNRSVEGMTVENALPETREQGFIDILDRVYESGKPFSGKEMPLAYDPDGTGSVQKRLFDLSYQPVFDTAGKVAGIVHIGVDVTERLREQELLRQFAAERDATLRQLTEGVIIADAEGRISFVNDAARRLHGVEALGVDVDSYSQAYNLLTEDGQPYPPRELPLSRAVLRDEYVTMSRWRIERPDGSQVRVEGSAQPVYDEARRKIAHVLTLREV